MGIIFVLLGRNAFVFAFPFKPPFAGGLFNQHSLLPSQLWLEAEGESTHRGSLSETGILALGWSLRVSWETLRRSPALGGLLTCAGAETPVRGEGSRSGKGVRPSCEPLASWPTPWRALRLEWSFINVPKCSHYPHINQSYRWPQGDCVALQRLLFLGGRNSWGKSVSRQCFGWGTGTRVLSSAVWPRRSPSVARPGSCPRSHSASIWPLFPLPVQERFSASVLLDFTIFKEFRLVIL